MTTKLLVDAEVAREIREHEPAQRDADWERWMRALTPSEDGGEAIVALDDVSMLGAEQAPCAFYARFEPGTAVAESRLLQGALASHHHDLQDQLARLASEKRRLRDLLDSILEVPEQSEEWWREMRPRIEQALMDTVDHE